MQRRCVFVESKVEKRERLSSPKVISYLLQSGRVGVVDRDALHEPKTMTKAYIKTERERCEYEFILIILEHSQECKQA